MATHVIAGSDGELILTSGDIGSITGDYYLHARSDRHASELIRIRVPGMGGGGLWPHAYEALHTMFGKTSEVGEQASVEALRRKRPSILLYSDDIGAAGTLPYLEISSDTQGFWVSVTNPGQRAGEIVRFTDDASVQALSRLYRGIQAEQKLLKAQLTQSIKNKTGYVYEVLGAHTWENNAREYDKWLVGQEALQPELQELYFGTARDVGIFLLKAGVELPAETKDRWMSEFGNLPQVKALTGPLR